MLSHSVVSDPLWPHGPLPASSSVHGISQQEYWTGLPFPPPGDLPNSGIKSVSLESPALAGGFFTAAPPGKPFNLSTVDILCQMMYSIGWLAVSLACTQLMSVASPPTIWQPKMSSDTVPWGVKSLWLRITALKWCPLKALRHSKHRAKWHLRV